ncbi:hypothetical protein ASG17_07510 [Brevundimonas sp. Leaf363]|uniref:DUF4376 domain-containing protein n=1 Tax=Brevundimonas sp. Leaf363 TaxID=1736353 RepID=UPI0006F95BCD|nr:hypothetical protein [Brevundimonas sp. Leaf363]KQS55888.1 hypothetical protein ASG17_07510 [Brevundimonas sp. Leaf363]
MQLIEHVLAADGLLFLKWDTENGPHRGSREPGHDLSDLPREVAAEIEAVWTPEFIAAWRAEHYPAPTFEEAKAAKNAAVTARREAVFAAGFTPSTGALAGHTLQVRNETDKINWLTSQASYSAAVMGGHGAVMGATFRTADNETVVASFAEGLQVIVVGMATWGQQIMGRSWVLKDQIDAAPDRAALDAIDINAGWPA